MNERYDFVGIPIVWLDAAINNSVENVEVQGKLRNLGYDLNTFDTTDDLVNYVQARTALESIILIVSGSACQRCVPRVHDLVQISLIYIFCFNSKSIENWAKQFSKVNVVETTDHFRHAFRSVASRRERSI